MNIRTVNFTDPSAGRMLVDSLHRTGFAVLRDHPIPGRQLEDIYRDWEQFFNSDEKYDYRFDPGDYDGTQQGYYPPDVSETAVGHTTRDLKEFFHVVPDGRIPPALQPGILAYWKGAFAVGRRLVNWLQQYTPAEVTRELAEPLDEILCGDASLLRILHYPPLTGREAANAERAAAHEDINLVTVLPVAEQPGLQVMDTLGNWVDVASRRGELVVNSGDMLREATGGYFPSTTHRVINPVDAATNVSRISAPFFLTPRLDVRLSDRYTAGSYLEERLKLITR